MLNSRSVTFTADVELGSLHATPARRAPNTRMKTAGSRNLDRVVMAYSLCHPEGEASRGKPTGTPPPAKMRSEDSRRRLGTRPPACTEGESKPLARPGQAYGFSSEYRR